MIKLSKNAKILGILMIVYSLVFHYYLSHYLAAGQHEKIIPVALTLFFVAFSTGLILGAFDPVRKSRSDLSFQYHLITYVVMNSTAFLWLATGLASNQEQLSHALLTAVSWGVGLIIHWFLSRRTIKGLPKASVFD